jgi:general secretion pathway protein D
MAADDPAKLFEEGRKAERAGHMVQAYLLYSRAAALDPNNQFYRIKSEAVQARAALESPPTTPPSNTTTDPVTGAVTVFDSVTAKDLAAERQMQPPVELKAAPGQKDFDLTGDAKALWEQVARAFGLDCVFDGDYQAGPRLRFQLTNVDYRDAIRGLEAATGSFVVPVSKRILLVVKETEQKRREVEPVEAAVIPVPQATSTQELTEIAGAVRQLFTLEHVAFDTSQNMVVLRGRISLVEPARLLFQELLRPRPEVNIEVELVEVDLTSSLVYGLDFLPTLPIMYLGTFWNNPLSVLAATIPTGINGLITFGGGQSMFGIAVGSATLAAQMTNSSTRTLLRSEIRAVDGTASSLHVGNRLPVLTSGYFGPASFSQGGQVYMPPPSFSFEDLGVTMKVTPRMHGMGEVTLDLETEFKVITGQSVNGIPIISNRKLATKVRMREGESAVVAGLLTSNEARSIAGIAGLGEMPGLGALFRQTNKSDQTSEVLLVIKPTLLSLPPGEFVTHTIFTGSETRPLTPL